jgi:hypothetical protein
MKTLFAVVLAIAMPAAAQAPVAPPPRVQIALNPDMRYAFIQGLVSEVGAPFIINGLADAKLDCDPQKLCITTDEIRQEAELDPALFARVHDMASLGKAVMVGGQPAKAIVSLETMYEGAGTFEEQPLLIKVSVFDVASATTKIFYADMEWRIHRPDMRAWLPPSMVGDDLRQAFGVPNN